MDRLAGIDPRIAERARHRNAAVRRVLAEQGATPAPVLGLLAGDSDESVRMAVAGNAATPAELNMQIARDESAAVRCALAHRFVGEGLDDAAREKLWRMGFTILEMLATDGLVRVRKVLAEGLRAMFAAPREIICTLAADSDPDVAGPILRHSPVLRPADLVDVMHRNPAGWVRDAIADRSDGAGNDPVVAKALAALSPPGAAAKPGTEEKQRVVTGATSRRRIFGKGLDGGEKTGIKAEIPGDEDRTADQVRKLHRGGQLTQNVIEQALDRGDQDFVMMGLALLAGLRYSAVRRMVASASGRVITSLAWKAGLSMRFAMDLQKRLARVPARQIVNARNGFDFPLSPDRMEQQLSYYTD